MLPPIIIVHYHLQPGGVTRVIEAQVKALEAADLDYLLLTGEEYNGVKEVRQSVIPDLQYKESADCIKTEGLALYQVCLKEVKKAFQDQEVIWHLHNPTLGKNILFPELLKHLASSHVRILMQCHDFAEDGRPTNFKRTSYSPHIYPVAPQIHYACINSRDQELLRSAGIPKPHTHALPNAVLPHPVKHKTLPPQKKTVLYPVRGIRRKNVGEFLLWSVLAPENTDFILSLPPNNPQWIPYYQAWEALAQELNLPVYLKPLSPDKSNERDQHSYEDWLERATHCFTTSVAEGFGLTFLEPSALGIPLIGRDLPDITKDFKNEGASLGNLYEKLLIPLSEIDQDLLKEELSQELEAAYLSYGRRINSSLLNTAWEKLTFNGMVDFGNLPEHHQSSLITHAAKEDLTKFYIQTTEGDIIPAKEWISSCLKEKRDHPKQLTAYSMQEYERHYTTILSTLYTTQPCNVEWIKNDYILETFLSPERFHFLRT